LSLTLLELKRRLPEKRDVSILLQDQTDYQTLVSVMDAVRAYRVKQGDDIVPVELFLDVSLGDVPVRNTLASIADGSGGV
jgi:hypothetical protein